MGRVALGRLEEVSRLFANNVKLPTASIQTKAKRKKCSLYIVGSFAQDRSSFKRGKTPQE